MMTLAGFAAFRSPLSSSCFSSARSARADSAPWPSAPSGDDYTHYVDCSVISRSSRRITARIATFRST